MNVGTIAIRAGQGVELYIYEKNAKIWLLTHSSAHAPIVKHKEANQN